MKRTRLSPFDEACISKLVQEELGKRQVYRPVYSLHKWWARRSGAQFRSVILAAVQKNGSLFEQDGNGGISDSSEYFGTHDLRNITILDPFMGGGTTLVEANRLGAKSIGCDINPVSYWVVRETLKDVDLRELRKWFDRLAKTAGREISRLYRTTCPSCGQADGETLYAFWVRRVFCPECHNEIPLFKRTLLNKGNLRNKPISARNPAAVFCPVCYHVFQWNGGSDCVCPSCSVTFVPKAGSYGGGRFSCRRCGKNNMQLVDLMKRGQNLEAHLVAIEYWCQVCNNRLYKSPDETDRSLLDRVDTEYQRMRSSLVVPNQEITDGSTSKRWRVHHYERYSDVFNKRQLLAYNIIIKEISEAPTEIRNAFVTILSNSLEYNNMMTPYNYPHRKLHHLFTYHALPLTTTPVENNVWGVRSMGAGTFVKCYERYVRAKRYCSHPFDMYKKPDGSICSIPTKGEYIKGHFVKSTEELMANDRAVLLLCRDSSSMPDIGDKSVDYIVTDPPYFDNVHYSELSNFFYVWLSSLVSDPFLQSRYVPVEKEAVVNQGIDKGEDSYRVLMTQVFSECRRVLKLEGHLIFTFHHTKWTAWWSILRAIKDSGFNVSWSFPVRSEYKVNPHIRNRESLDVDLVLFCDTRETGDAACTLQPHEMVPRILSQVESRDSSMERNWLLVHLMGRLMEIASVTDVTREWFRDCLESFQKSVDDMVSRPRKPNRQHRDSHEQMALE